jgi:serine/threonine-protein kinase
MGEVFLAWDDRLGRRVAIKRIRPDIGLSSNQRERLRREARAAARLSHSAIVQVYELIGDAMGDAIVLEYIEGVTLAARLADGPLAPGVAVRLGRQIAEGLAAAHDAGMIHRDLKAENVIVTPSGQAKILDFGLARPVIQSDEKNEDGPLTERGALVGTYHAMSPEQAGGGELDSRSDLFSFGALLYEMLTGKAPFRGKNALETLKRVLAENPLPLRGVRPDLPAALGAVVDRLLAKDREARPHSARSVASVLAGIEAREWPRRDDDLPTEEAPVAREGPLALALPPGHATPTSTLGLSLRHRHRYGIAAVLVVALTLAAGALVLFMTRRPARALRVIVARPEVVSAAKEHPQLDLAASGVLSSALSALASLEGLAPIDPLEANGGGTSPLQLARTVAADEVLTATIEPEEGAMGRVSLRRIQGRDGRVLWAEAFKVPIDPQGLRSLADTVAMHLGRAYPDQRLRPGTPDLEVRDEDYTAFLEVKKRIDAGVTDLEPELARLETIAQSSPRFLEARILGAQVAVSLSRTWPSRSYLDRAAPFVRQAKELAPNDPRPLIPEFQIALARSRDKDAEAILATLERLLPGDPEVLHQRSLLAEQQGRLDEAQHELLMAVDRTPSWQNLFWLGRLETRRGQAVEARRHFDAALRLAPNNDWIKTELAFLEMKHGDLAYAEVLFANLAGSSPTPDRWVNLGVIRFLRSRFADAAAAFRRALELDPDNPIALINLADTEIELGRKPAAQVLYGKALGLLEKAEATGGPSPATGMERAECLARLGRRSEAAALAQSTLRRSPDEPELLYTAALVYSLIGDRNTALINAQAALEKGENPRWFMGSAFRSLNESPEMQTLLQAATAKAEHNPAPHQ